MGKMSTESETKTRIEIRTDITPPPQFRVIFVNDSVTTMDFVVEMLVTIFSYNSEIAKQTTILIHENGSAVVAVMPFELAEQKALEVTAIARSNGFPLNVKLEPNV
jgi:ATP-dependent Clp protease adaptor protein ClpS